MTRPDRPTPRHICTGSPRNHEPDSALLDLDRRLACSAAGHQLCLAAQRPVSGRDGHCSNIAIKQSDDPDQPDTAPYQACVKPYVDAIGQMAKYLEDPAVSVDDWSACRRASNFAQNGNFPGWASCIAQRLQKK